MKSKTRKWALVALISALFVFAPVASIDFAQSTMPTAVAEEAMPAEACVAKVGNAEYETLEAAFAAAVEGDTIVLYADATPALQSQRVITKASVIDLNGNKLTLTEDDLYFGTTTFKNGTIVVDSSVKPSTAVFWMFANQTLTFDNVKLVATGVTGTYLIGLDGNNSDLNLLNGSEILVENTTALDLDIICVNASTGNDIVVENSKVNVTNLDGRVFFRGNYTISGNTEVKLSGITKAGFRIEAGQTLNITDNASVVIEGEPRDGGIHLTETTATYTKADTATVNATFKINGLKGSGTEADPFLINNINELIWFRDKVDEQAADGSTQFAGKYFKLTADIDLDGINWNPIGSMTGDHGSFQGVFDGDGHTISNLYVEQAGNGLGLFARTAGNAEIKNVNLENVTLKSTNNANYLGGLVGNAYASTKITNVHVSGDVYISGRGYLGGIAGHGYVVMDNVSVKANANSLITSTFWCAGGILGYGGEGITNIMNAHVEGLTITSAAGGLGAIVGMAEDNNGTQPISGSNLSAANVEIETYVGAYGTAYANYALGYLYGGNPTSKLTGELTVEDVKVETSTGEVPAVNDAIASVDGKIYFDLASAVAASGEVKLIRDVTLNDTLRIDAGKTVTLDLNGKTISQEKACTASYSMIENKGNLTITGNGKISFKDTGAGDPNFGWGSYTIYNAGNLTVENGTIEHLGTQTFATHMICAIFQYSGSTTINGGTISTPNYRSARLWKGDMIINGGNFDGQIWVQAVDNTAKLTINGGTFEPNGGDGSSVFVSNSTYDVALAVTGGNFNTKIGCSDAAKLAGAITGGTFTATAVNGTNNALLAEGLIFDLNADGWYGVERGLLGQGTEADPYLIANVDDLILFRDSVNAGETKYNAAGVYVALAADIDLSSVANWAPIGTFDYSFDGNFDGKNHKIKNLKISDNTAANGEAYLGFFGVTANNTIGNFVIENVTINSNGQIVAAAIAYPYYTVVKNITVCGDIAIKGGNYTAGVLAYTRLCETASNLTVNGNAGSYITGGRVVGGIIADIQMNHGLVADYSNFSVSNVTISGTMMVGGISGIIATQTVDGCSVKNVVLVATESRVGIVAGCFGGTSTIKNVTVENVTGASVVIGGTYDTDAPVEAKVGDVYYGTFEEAFEAAQEGDTIDMFVDVEATEVILIDKSLTINGNGHEIISTATRVIRITTSNVVVTLNDVNAVSKAVRVGTSDIRGFAIDAALTNVEFTLNNCSVDFADVSACDWAYAVNVAGNGTGHKLTINGGSYEGANVINVHGSNNVVTVKDATLTSLYPNNDVYYGAGIWVKQESGSSVVATGNTFNGGNTIAFNLGTGTQLEESNNTNNMKRVVAKIGSTYYTSLAEALAAVGAGDVVIELLANATLDYNAREAYGTADTTSITINGNGKTLTLNQKNSDWSSIGLANANGKLVLNNMTIEKTGYGDTSGAWNTHAINFKSNVEMNNVEVNNSMAVSAGAKLNNVTINEANGYYGLWISANAQTVTVNGGAITATNGGRGIKIADEYVSDVQKVTLNVTGMTFNTAKKAAVLVTSTAGATITASNVDITNVAEDKTSFVWVDDNRATYYGNVEVVGATKAQESVADFVAAVSTNNTINAYYKTLADAIKAAKAGDTVLVYEGTYAVPSMKAGITIEGVGKVLFEGTLSGTLENLTMKNIHIKGGNAQRWAYAKGDLVFENVTFEATSVYALHFDGISSDANLLYKNCTIIGWAALGGSPASCTFDGCTIKGNGAYGVIRTYFDTTIENCTFDVANVNPNDAYQDGIHAVEGAEVVVDNCTNVNGDMKALINVHASSVVVLDGVEIKNVAKVGGTYYETLAAALAAVGAGDVVIELLRDATLDYNAREAYGTADTTSITINGNGKTLTLNQKNSDWSSIGLANANGKLVLNNMTIEKTGYGDTSGAWNTHAINFKANVEMNDVTVNNAMAVSAGAKLNNVTINEANGYYGLWISANAQTVTVNGGAINATNGGRGIKIADEYVSDVQKVTLNVTGMTFNTAKKAAVLVTSTAGATITASNVDITNVVADKTSFVWVDEDRAAYYGNVEVDGATKAQESAADFVVAVFENDAVSAYYKTLADAFVAVQDGTTITLVWSEGDAPIAMNGAVYGKTVTITGTATVDWSKGFLFIGRGGEGNGTVIFDNANLTSASNSASYGIHVSGREKNTSNKYDGTLVIKNSKIELDYLINKGTMTLNNSALTVKNGFAVGGRPASETESGVDATATLTLTNSDLVVNNHNGMGLGYEAIGVMNVDKNSTFKCTQSFLVTAKGTMNVSGVVEVAGTLTNKGTIVVNAECFSAETYAVKSSAFSSTGKVEAINANGVYAVIDAIGIKLAKCLRGAGTEADPYLIANVDDLILFRDSVNAGETKYNAAGVYVALAADIDLSSVANWAPIGTFDYSFDGNFDGKNHKIMNLKISDNTAANGEAYLGFFGVTANNTIGNFVIENVTINSNGQIVAAAIAYPYYTVVKNITVCGDIAIKGGNYTAGVLAYTRLCETASNLTVNGNAGSYITGGRVVGGIIADIQMNHGLVADYSDFSVSNVTISGTMMVGGISGIISMQTLDGCSVKDVVLVGADSRVGAVAGCLGGTSTIKNVTVENVTGASVVVGGTYDTGAVVEAKVGDVYYATFEAAYAAANAGETVTLLQSIKLSEILVIDKAIVLDGNGCTLTSTAARAINVSGANGVTIKNLTINTSGERAINVIQKATNITIDNVKATASNYTVNVASSAPNAVVTIKDSTLNGLCTVNVTAPGANVTITDTEINCNDNNATVGESYAALTLGRDAVGGKIAVTGCEIYVAAGSDSLIARNAAKDGIVTIDGSTDDVTVMVAAITYAGSSYYYTFATLEAAFAAAQNGDVVEILVAGTYALGTSGKNITVTGAVDGVVFDNIGAKNMGGANVTFNNVTFDYYPNVNYTGLQHSGNLVYNNCTFNGQVFLYGASETFNNCTFNQNSANAYNVWTYSAKEVAFNNCTFNSVGKSVLVYNETASAFTNLAVANTTFNASAAAEGKAAIEIDTSLTAGANITVTNSTATGFGTGNVSGNSLWNNKKGSETIANNDITIKVGEEVVLEPVVYVATIGNNIYTKIVDAIKAAKAGDVVTIVAGEYTETLSVNKAITVVGETASTYARTATQNNLVTIKGKLNITANGATVKNINVNNGSSSAGYISAKDVLVEGCTVVGGNGFRSCYTSGTVTFKDSVITGSTYGIHFDGSAGGEIVIDNCVITGWTSFAKTIKKVTMTDTTFEEGNYNYIRFYQEEVVLDGCTFNEKMGVDVDNSVNATVTVTNCTVANGNVENLFEAADIAKSTITVDGETLVRVAKIGNTYYETLADALAAVGAGDVVIELLANATLDYNAREAYGTADTTSITINGNGKILTLNQKDSDWSSIGLANANGKLVLNNMTIEKTGYGDTSGAWNTHAINFTSNVEMNDVTVNNSMSVEAGATLNNVTINEANGYYGLWIDGNGQTVTVNGGAINATNGGRGIKIADEYVGDVKQVTLNVTGTKFNTAKKAAVLVTSTAGATITASNVDITNVVADSTNFVWVDEDRAAYYGNVEVVDATKAQENVDNFVVIAYVNGSINGYYTKLADAINSAKAGKNEIVLLADCAENVTIAQKAGVNIVINGNNNEYTGTITIDGKDRINGAETVTIKNVEFKAVKNNQIFIVAKESTESHNVTIQDVTMDGNGMANVYGMQLRHAYDYAMISVKATNMYDVVYAAKTVDGFTANEVTLENVENGFLFGHTAVNLTFSDVEIDAANTGIFVRNNTPGTATFENCTITALDPVVLDMVVNKDYTLVFGENNEFTSSDGKEVEVTGANKDKAKITLADNSGVNVEQTNAVAVVGGVYYASLQKAFDVANGETVKLVQDITIEDTVRTIKGTEALYGITGGKNVTLDLNGKKVTIDATYNGVKAYFSAIFLVENGTLTVGDSVGGGKIFVEESVAYLFRSSTQDGIIVVNGGEYETKIFPEGAVFMASQSNTITVNGGVFNHVNVGWIFNTAGNGSEFIDVYGGIYNRTPFENIHHEGRIPFYKAIAEREDGWFEVVDAAAYIVSADGTEAIPGFATFQEAYAVVNAGESIIVLAPITVAAGETMTLNKGITITYVSNVAGEDMITNNGTLIVDGDTIVYTNTDNTGSNVTVSTISAAPGSETIVKSGTVMNKSENGSQAGRYAFALDLLTNGGMGDVTATISGGEIISENYMAIRQFNNGTQCKNSLTIKGGYVYGATRAVQVHLKNDAAYTTITGGVIEGGQYALCLFPTAFGALSVTGGEFLGEVYSGTNGFISGGSFTTDVNDYCAEGFFAVQNAGGTYRIVASESFEKVNMTISSSLTINYYVDLTTYFEAGAMADEILMQFEFPNMNTLLVSGVQYEGNLYKYSFSGVAPQQMGDTIRSTLLVNDEIAEIKEYSIARYCYDSLKKSAQDLGLSDEKYNAHRNLVVDLLKYGAAAQNYKDYNVDALVTAELTEEQLKLGSAYGATYNREVANDNMNGIDFTAAQVYYDNMVSVRFYFKVSEGVDVTKLYIYLNNVRQTGTMIHYDAEYQEYYVETEMVKATDFDKAHYLLISTEDTLSSMATALQVVYDVNTYIYNIVNKATSGVESVELVKALYAYGRSAELYVWAK